MHCSLCKEMMPNHVVAVRMRCGHYFHVLCFQIYMRRHIELTRVKYSLGNTMRNYGFACPICKVCSHVDEMQHTIRERNRFTTTMNHVEGYPETLYEYLYHHWVPVV